MAVEIFTREAMEAIHRAFARHPRTISVICDNALVSGFAAEATADRPRTSIREVCDDFDLKVPVAAARGSRGRSRSRSPRPRRRLRQPLSATPKTVASDPADRLFASYGKRRGFSFF